MNISQWGQYKKRLATAHGRLRTFRSCVLASTGIAVVLKWQSRRDYHFKKLDPEQSRKLIEGLREALGG